MVNLQIIITYENGCFLKQLSKGQIFNDIMKSFIYFGDLLLIYKCNLSLKFTQLIHVLIIMIF